MDPCRKGRMMAVIRTVNSALKPLGKTALIISAVVIPLCAIMSSGCSSGETAYDELRSAMVRTQIESRGIDDERVLAAMRKVPRHRFVPENVRHLAYRNQALPIGHEQTISQPFIVAFMTQALRLERSDVVLEIGTGSAYQAAVLAELAERVYTIEIVEPL